MRAIAREFANDPRQLIGILVLGARGIGALRSIVSGIIYLLSPLDLIPEIYFGPLGLIDDFIVFLTIIVLLAAVYRAFLVNRGRERNR